MAISNNKMNLSTENSVDPDLFAEPVNSDYICIICSLVPKRPYESLCCGKISCHECLLKWINDGKPTCPNCRVSCTTSEIAASSYISNKIAGLSIKCPYRALPTSNVEVNEKLDIGVACGETVLFGKEGSRLAAHMDICSYKPLTCPDCHNAMTRSQLKTHRPSSNYCPLMLITCEICQIKLLNNEMENHIKQSMHLINTTKKQDKIFDVFKQFEKDYIVMNTRYNELKNSVDSLTGQLQRLNTEFKSKTETIESHMQQKMKKLGMCIDIGFLEFEVTKWSQIMPTSLISNSLQAWGHEWSLRIYKEAEFIGFYLCCGTGGQFPITINFQMMIKKRSTDEAICLSTIYPIIFKESGTMGLSKYTTLGQIERGGGYLPQEDIIHFGCRIYPSGWLAKSIKPV